MNTTTVTAAKVRSVLRAAGIRTVPTETRRSRQGVRVTTAASGGVFVSADLDSAIEALRLTDEIEDVLRLAGLRFDHVDSALLKVVGR